MKLAFISDIHANLPALESVLADIALHQPDDIYCLGDTG
ncbi:metallophosphoesterase family protein [Puia sp. P3]